MRKLITKDLFNAMRLVRVSGVKEALKPVFSKAAEKDAEAVNVGIEAILTIAEALSGEKAEENLYEFLAGPFEMDAEEIGGMEIGLLAEHLERLAKENDIKAFFRQLSGLTTSVS